MAEENNTDEVETEEKTLEDQLAALEEVAASLGEDTEIKSDHSAEECEDDDCEEHGTKDASDEDASAEDAETKDDAPAEDAPEENMEEKVAAAVEEVLAEGEEVDEKAATLTGFPHDRVVLDDDDQEDDSEDLLKPPGGVENAKEGVPKKRVIVVEMDPEQITEDMKAYVVEVDDDKASIDLVPEEEEVPVRPVLDVPRPPVLEEEDAEEMTHPARPNMGSDVPTLTMPVPVAEEEEEDDKGWGKKPGKNRLARLMALANGDDPDEEEKEAVPAPNLPTAILIGKEDSEPMSVNDHLDQEALANRLERLGTDTKSLGGDGYLCAIERTVRGGDVCNFCRGGCASEKGLPGLLEIEVMAETEFKGEVVDSGYAPKDDIFVLDLKTADGFIETYYAGNGSSLGWIALDGEVEEKTAEAEGTAIVSFEEAEMVALKNVKGKSLGVDVDIFQGEDAYVVEIDGIDGKSYDAYVGVDGQFLGSDMIELTDEEAAEIKELQSEKDVIEAEIGLKRLYPASRTEQLIEDGFAMSDGRFPIVTRSDLTTVIVAAGSSKSLDIRGHITKRAEELEATDLIPEGWSEEKTAEEAEFVASLMEMQMMEVEEDLDTE